MKSIVNDVSTLIKSITQPAVSRASQEIFSKTSEPMCVLLCGYMDAFTYSRHFYTQTTSVLSVDSYNTGPSQLFQVVVKVLFLPVWQRSYANMCKNNWNAHHISRVRRSSWPHASRRPRERTEVSYGLITSCVAVHCGKGSSHKDRLVRWCHWPGSAADRWYILRENQYHNGEMLRKDKLTYIWLTFDKCYVDKVRVASFRSLL